jgi:hypothetical protein
MKKDILKPILGLILATVAVVVILKKSEEIASLKDENENLRKHLDSKTDVVPTKHNLNEGSFEPNQITKLSEENERLNEELRRMRLALAEIQDEEKMLQEQVEELTKPFEEKILSSTLKTTVGKGEILVTGGYQNADGNFQYAMVEPVMEQLPDGRKVIRIKSLQYSMPPEVMKEFGLDTLSTNARNTLQHGEIWSADELRSLNEKIANTRGVDLMTSPQVTVLPGKKAEVMIGAYKMSTTPGFSEDGSGFDIELRIEQPRDPEGIAQPSGAGQQR